MISDSDLAYIRSQAAKLLPDTCTIQRVTRPSDGAGGYTETWTDYATHVPCRLAVDRTQPREELQVGQVAPAQRYWLTLQYDQAIAITDRVVKDGQTFEVIGIDDAKSYSTAKRVQLVAK